MQHSNYVDYEQMSTEIINSKYNNIGISKKPRKIFTKRRIIFLIIFLSLIILILYLIFRPKKKSPENNPIENNDLNDLSKEFESLSKKEEELKNENNKLKSQKDSLQKENDDLDKQIKELNEKNKQNDNDKNKEKKEIEEKKAKVKEYEKKLEDTKENIKKLNKKEKDLKDKKEENDKEIKSLESKIEELEKELNTEQKEENKNNSNKKDEEPKKTDEEKKSDEPQPTNPELASRIDSKIIMEIKHLELLDKWFGKKLKYKLLFRATEESYSSSEFHKKVDEYKNTIIFIKDINNFIYGGFTTKTWDGNKLYKSDKNSILFNLDKEKYYEVNNVDHAIFCDKEQLAVFGDGDLILGPKSIESAFPKSFGNKDIKENELTMGYNKLSPVELEVFQLSS